MKRLVVALGLLPMLASPALANWTASGTFQYQDRDWDNTGFTGSTTNLPIRFADVQLYDVNKNGGAAILANTKTDANGAYSVLVADNQTRTVAVRVLTSTTQTSDLFVKVVDHSGGQGNVYAVVSSPVSGHNPNTNVNFGTQVVQALAGGEAFNILDLGIYGADFIKVLTGSRPGSSKLVTFKWAINGGVGTSGTTGNTCTMRDTAGYDDLPILHEWGHYIMTSNYSRSTTPAGSHALSNCDEHLDLAFDEGRASTFGAFVRRHNGMPYANWYIRTDGGSGAGHLVNAYNLEDATEYPCIGDTSEVSCSRSMWDIGDSASTTDDSPGVDDDPPDALALADSQTWEVFNGPIKNGSGSVNLEDFWDGWFDASVANGFKPEMTDIFSNWVIEFFQDAYEPNNTTATATFLEPVGSVMHNTYFYDPDGDGKGQADTDYFKFDAVSGQPYSIRTQDLISDANTKLELLDTNGTTVLVASDDQSASDPSSLISWTAPASGLYYIRSTHSADAGIYGSYDLVVEGPSCGTTPCALQFCVGYEGGEICHQGGGVCSGNIDSGWNSCVDRSVIVPCPIGQPCVTEPDLVTCPAGQHVRLQTCPCTCLGNSCGTRIAVRGCE